MAPADAHDELHDADLAADIALLGDILAATAGQPELTQADVDAALGLPASDSTPRRARRPATDRVDSVGRPAPAPHR